MFVSAHAPGYASRGETGIEVGPGETAGPIHVVVDRAFSINGLVVRKENTQPASGLTVHAFIGTARGADVSTTTRADGTFTIDGLMPGLYGIEIFDGDSLRLEGPPVEVRDRDVIDQLYAVARGVTIRGRVEPAGVMRVAVAGEEATTKPDGAFAFHNLLPGTYNLSASEGAHLDRGRHLRSREPGDPDQDLVAGVGEWHRARSRRCAGRERDGQRRRTAGEHRCRRSLHGHGADAGQVHDRGIARYSGVRQEL